MIVSASTGRKFWCMASFLVVLLLMAGCAGMAPYEPRNNREEGPEKGVFTGSEGEFVILHKGHKPETDSEETKSPDDKTKDKP